VIGEDRVAFAEPARTEDGEGPLERAEAARRPVGARGEEHGEVRAAKQCGSHVEGERGRVDPPIAGRRGVRDLGGHRAQHEVEQRLAIGDMPVERHDAAPEALRDGAHRQASGPPASTRSTPAATIASRLRTVRARLAPGRSGRATAASSDPGVNSGVEGLDMRPS
jgi:hypothetical protein